MSERPGIDFAALRADESLLVHVVQTYVTGGRPLIRTGPRYRLGSASAEATSVTVYRASDGAWKYHRFSVGEDGDVLDVLRWYAGARNVVDAALMVGALPPIPERILRRRSRAEDHPTPPRWRGDRRYADALVEEYARHPEALARWRAYKPLLARQVRAEQLGYGVLPRHEIVGQDGRRRMVYPAGCSHPRLIYPVRQGGCVVAIRGRHAGCACDPKRTKWLNAKGSTAHLFGLERVRPGDRVVLCENPIDAMLGPGVEPDCVCCAPTAGAGTWHQEWTDLLAAARPHQVLVWYDHDLAGNGYPGHCPNCAAAHATWQRAHPTTARPPPGGLRVARALRAAGIERVDLYPWRGTDPPGADLGDVLSGYLAVRRGAPLDVKTPTC